LHSAHRVVQRSSLLASAGIYVIGGWLFAFLYFLLFASPGLYTWWLGAVMGSCTGSSCSRPGFRSCPIFHPRMASEYDGATAVRQLEPSGFIGLNYGHRTPVTTLLGQAVYGAVLGGLPQLQELLQRG
jgi:hypothetical protein